MPEINSVDDYFDSLDESKLVHYKDSEALKRAAELAGQTIDEYCIAAIEGPLRQYCQLSTLLTVYQTRDVIKMYGSHRYYIGIDHGENW